MVGGIRPSAGVVLPLLPPALLHYTINRRKLQAVRQKICAKKVEMLGGVCPARHRFALPLWCLQGELAFFAACQPCLSLAFLPPIPPTPFPDGEGGAPKFISPGASPPAPLHLTACGTHRACQAGTRSGALPLARRGCGGVPIPCEGVPSASPVRRKTDRTAILLAVPAAKERGDRGRGTSAFEMVLSPGAGRASAAGGKPPPPGTTAAGIAGSGRNFAKSALQS